MSNVDLDETIEEQTDPYNEMNTNDQELIQDDRQRPCEYTPTGLQGVLNMGISLPLTIYLFLTNP